MDEETILKIIRVLVDEISEAKSLAHKANGNTEDAIREDVANSIKSKIIRIIKKTRENEKVGIEEILDETYN